MSRLHTRAWVTLEQNLEGVNHFLALQLREMTAMRTAVARMRVSGKKSHNLAAKAGKPKLLRSIKRFAKNLDVSIDRLHTARLWSVVLLVTCVEAYLQDVLSTAASVDPELMSKSEQLAPYADVIGTASVEELANELRARWARGWLNDGGPTRWLLRFHKMGARGYPDDLALRLERIWGIRHVVVHAAGVTTADFVKRHPGVVAARGDRLRVPNPVFKRFVLAVYELVEPTEAFFLARYPAIERIEAARA